MGAVIYFQDLELLELLLSQLQFYMCFCDYLRLPLSLDLRAETETLLLIHVSLETNTE